MKEILARFIERENPLVIDDPLRRRIAEELAPVSPRLLRTVLRESGVPLAPLVEGVRQDSLADLERTLLGLAQEYRQGDADTKRLCRKLVIEGKDHARLVQRNEKVDPQKREAKEEMILWMMTWLENPGVFVLWLGLRKAAIATPASPLE